MKKFLSSVVIVGFTFALVQCTAKKNSPASAAKKEAKKIYTVAKKRWPEIRQANLDSGKVIYNTKCSKCHAAKPIAIRSEVSWNSVIEKMAPKAKLTPAQKENVTHYILASREAGLH